VKYPLNPALDALVRRRPGLAELFSGGELSLSPNYPHSCVQSDYARIHLQNAADLLRASHHIDCAVPGSLFLLRQGLELWFKCIASNIELDEILHIIIHERPQSFTELSARGVFFHGRSQDVARKNQQALSRGLCAFRNLTVDKMRAPDMWTKRSQGDFPDQAIQALVTHSDFSRELFGRFYLPLIGGHELGPVWALAKSDMSQRVSAVDEFGRREGYDERLDLALLDDLVEVFALLDPDGDALRYPFSISQEWHDHMPPMSKSWLERTIDRVLSQVVNERGERSQRYAISTIAGGVESWILSLHRRPS